MGFVTDQSKLDAASTYFETRFGELYNTGGLVTGYYERLTTKIPTDSKKIQVDFLGSLPAVEKWVGAKTFKTIRNYQQTATLDKWHKTFRIDRMDVRYDRTGQVGSKIDAFLNDLASFYDKIVTDVFVSNPTGYDGVALFSASHPHGPAGATQSNLTTSALSFATFNTAMVAIMGYLDESSEPLPVTQFGQLTLMVGPKLLTTALEIAEAELKPVGVDAGNVFYEPGATPGTNVAATTRYNVWRGKVDVIVNNRLNGTYDDYWFLLNNTVPGASPILLYEGRAPEPIPCTDMDSTPRFINDEFWYSVEADAVAVAGAWQTVYAGIL